MSASIGADVTVALGKHGIEARLLPSPPSSFPIWLIDVTRCRTETLGALLSDEERGRAARFKSAALHDRYVTGHASLRVLLRCFFGISPENIIVERNEFGKPRLSLFPRLHYSMSYSENYVMVGLNEGEEIGVDIETLRPVLDALELADIHFTRKEQTEIRSAGASTLESFNAFLKIWVRKEAVVKAFGCGLSIPLNEVECGGEGREKTVRLSECQCCRTGILQLRGDPNMAWARR